MSPRDAQMYWISRRLPSDQYLLYCFDESAEAPEPLRRSLIRRASRIAELGLRVAAVPGKLDYPYWAPAAVTDAAVVSHDGSLDWPLFRDALADLLQQRLDAQERPWRLHLFHRVSGAPGGRGRATVAVLRIAHALADGREAARIARELFQPAQPPPARRPAAPAPAIRVLWGGIRLPAQFARTILRGARAASVYRQLRIRGMLQPVPAGQPLTVLNADPGRRRAARMIVLPRRELQLPGHTITVSVLTAISLALPRYLAHRGVPPAQLGAEVTIALPPRPGTRNNFRNAGISLPITEVSPQRRAALIATALRERAAAHDDPLARAQAAVTAVLPAIVLSAEVAKYSLESPPATVSGNTVVSSVNRGPADLRLGGGKVRFTAGFPALSPAMGLTHGVHGIGDMITVSVHSSPAILPDPDHYAALLTAAIAQVSGRPRVE